MRVLSQQTLIQAPRRVVWEALADFGNVDAWAPSMRICQIIGDQDRGVGTRRRMQHAWGFVFEELVTEWVDEESFSFQVLSAPFPMIRVQETWQLSGDERQTRVATQVRYEMSLGILGRMLDHHMVRFIVQKEMKSGLLGLERYVTNGAGT